MLPLMAYTSASRMLSAMVATNMTTSDWRDHSLADTMA
jgi:hypothetical protein